MKKKQDKLKQQNLMNNRVKNAYDMKDKGDKTSLTTTYEADFAKPHNTLPPDSNNTSALKKTSSPNVNSIKTDRTEPASLFDNAESWKNMQKFHQSMEMTIYQCTVCKEAWPMNRTDANNHYVCYRCKRDKKQPKKFSNENSMIPSAVPLELQNLTQFEEMLIARAFPIIHVYTKPKGGQRAYKGHVITLPQNVQQLADVLPRCPPDLPVIVFTVNGKDNASRDFVVRRKNVSDALHWLVKNNPLYANVTIDYEKINMLPQNNNLENVTKIDFKSSEDHQLLKKGTTSDDAERLENGNCAHDDDCNKNDQNDHDDDEEDFTDNEDCNFNIGIDRGPINTDDDTGIVYDENAEMSSFMPTAIDHQKEADVITESIRENATNTLGK